MLSKFGLFFEDFCFVDFIIGKWGSLIPTEAPIGFGFLF